MVHIDPAQDSAEMVTLVERRFAEEGDVDRALGLIAEHDGVDRTIELARHHAGLAVDAIAGWEDSEAKRALLASIQGSHLLTHQQ